MESTVTRRAGYPEAPVRLVVPFPPRGSTDFTARTVAEQMARILGQPFVVENKVGDSGIVGLRELVGASPYTLMVGNVNTNSIAPVLFRRKMDFDYETAITPVSRLAEFPSVLVVRVSVPATTLQELLDYAKKSWGRIRNGTDWIGSFPDLDGVMLGKRAGIEVVNIPSPGGAEGLLAALVDGDIDMVFLNVMTAGRGIDSGKLKAIAVTGPSRLARFPNVRTMGESGFEGIGTSHWQGLFAPGRTPAEVVRLLHRAVVRALGSDEAKGAFETVGARVAASASPEQFVAEIHAEMARWEKVSAAVRGSQEGQ